MFVNLKRADNPVRKLSAIGTVAASVLSATKENDDASIAKPLAWPGVDGLKCITYPIVAVKETHRWLPLFFTFLSLFSTTVYAQEQMAVAIGNNGKYISSIHDFF